MKDMCMMSVHYRFRHSTQWYTSATIPNPQNFLEFIRQYHGLEKIVFDDLVHTIRPNMWIIVRWVPRHWIRPPPPTTKEINPQESMTYSTDDEFGQDVYVVPKKSFECEKRNVHVKKFVFYDFDTFEYV